ncbi:PAS domain-containing sensor histidine kinase [Desulfosporosinus sp. Sb-LF]|uniref:PAS domain-containing sensor histidine kinase n=1 Tax=Desulfosporosinus sp. Sb-LF TaxID=2560027 RepID=UPI00107F02F8|nr:PAS domain-containing sensor histidine kinase [Desulfosporosinus sp. Sb-LF]TGE34471.1 PAS domain-containing sensor histidine kinase [Desulfosporosinus sp. Sb-LF]
MAQNIIQEYVHPNDKHITLQEISTVTKGQCFSRFENRYRIHDGSYIRLSWMLIPFANNKLYYAVGRETNKEKILKEKQKRSSLMIESVYDNISDCFYTLDDQWRFIYVNKSAAIAFSKVTDQNVIGKNYWDIFPGKDDFFFLKLLEASLSQKHVQFEAVSIFTQGWVKVNVYPSSECVSVYFRDISEQKKYEKSLEAERNRLYALINGLPGLVYLRTGEGNVIFANHNFIEAHGEPDNQKCYSILFNKDAPCSHCQTQLTSKTDMLNQWQCVVKDTIYEVFEHSFYDSDGTRLFLMQLLDVTKRTIAEEEIARLDRLNLVGELAASIAHEVRNPMTTVRGFLQILKSRNTSHENEDYFDLMISELDRANSILTEFLSLSKTKTGLYSDVRLNKLVKSLYPLILSDALNQDKQVLLVVDEVAELTMIEREIRQLILNLTRNGLEAMSSGGILKIMTYMESNSIVLAVQDQGTGISNDLIARIGTPFLTTKESGTGLGLATCYNIAERHNAKIDVESSPSGTTFYVRFNIH